MYEGEITSTAGCSQGIISAVSVCDFSSWETPGRYFVSIPGVGGSPVFSVQKEAACDHPAEEILHFFRSQRCGVATPLHGPCHQHDGSKEHPLTGGWHDAGDYLKFVVTTSFVTIEMLSAVLAKNSTETRLAASVLREARVGVEWLLKMTDGYADGRFYYQVGHPDDHRFWRLPEADRTGQEYLRTAYAGWGKNLNGLAIAVFSMAARAFVEDDPDFAACCGTRAEKLWELRDSFPDVQNTTPESFYTQSDSKDSMLLGAVQLYILTGREELLPVVDNLLKTVENYNIGWGNVGFLALITAFEAGIDRSFCTEVLQGCVENLAKVAKRSPFCRASELVWGSSAQIAADAQKILLYEECTGDRTFRSLAIAQVDYLLGANPWGVSFVVGVGCKYPRFAHSQLNDLAGLQRGAVVGGPGLRRDWEKFLSLPAGYTDVYGPYQGAEVFYDWIGDYYTNEVAIDYAVPLLAVFTLLQ